MIKVQAGSVANKLLKMLHIPHMATIEAQCWEAALFHVVMDLRQQVIDGNEPDFDRSTQLLVLFERAVDRGWTKASATETLAFMLSTETTPEEAALLIASLKENDLITEQDFRDLIWSTSPKA